MKSSRKKHIVVGLSGGVDSSVTALLLKQQGYHVEGVFMKNWEEDDTSTSCPASLDMADASAVCEKLDIPFTVVNFAEKYWEKVFARFLRDHQKGLTPNPDILCNQEIKFRAFLDYAANRGADAIATGHYARTEGGRLWKGKDSTKDQSYFLHALSREQLSFSLFPLGELEKSSVRTLAKTAGLHNHARKDSTGICFIGEKRFRPFLAEYLPATPGPMETPEGKVIGEHAGLMYYTIGQRQGLEIGGRAESLALPWYVLDKDLERNVLIVGQGSDHPLLYSNTLMATEVHWIEGAPPLLPLEAHAKTRYRQPDEACIIRDAGENACEVTFLRPQRAVTPGQSVVFYQGDRCLGGGIIVKSL